MVNKPIIICEECSKPWKRRTAVEYKGRMLCYRCFRTASSIGTQWKTRDKSLEPILPTIRISTGNSVGRPKKYESSREDNPSEAMSVYLKKQEHELLYRHLMEHGYTPEQAKKYISDVKDHIRKAHSQEKVRLTSTNSNRSILTKEVLQKRK